MPPYSFCCCCCIVMCLKWFSLYAGWTWQGSCTTPFPFPATPSHWTRDLCYEQRWVWIEHSNLRSTWLLYLLLRYLSFLGYYQTSLRVFIRGNMYLCSIDQWYNMSKKICRYIKTFLYILLLQTTESQILYTNVEIMHLSISRLYISTQSVEVS